MTTAERDELNGGYRYALLAYGAWGLLPLYWKLLRTVPAVEILFHRVVWSWVFYVLIQVVRDKRLPRIPKIEFKLLCQIGMASILLGINWLIYIYAVNSGHIVEASLGYFINPLVVVLIGVFLMGEKLQRYHRVALSLCTVGVVILTVESGRPPWIALGLALTFGFYGAIKKRISMAPVRAGQWESFLIILPLALGLKVTGFEFHNYSGRELALLLGTGIVTGLPLLWFMNAAKRLPFYLMGIFQYLSPTLQFLTGVLVFHETISPLKGVGFIFIWCGILWILRNSLGGRAKAAILSS